MRDNYAFLFEATRCLFSSLQIEPSLRNFYVYIKNRLPVREISLNKTIMPFITGVVVAQVNDEGVKSDWSFFPLTDAQKKLWKRMLEEYPPYGICERMIVSEDDILYRYYMLGPRSEIRLPIFFLRLIKDGEIIGSCRFATTRVLTPQEQRMLVSLESPLGIALNNLLQYRELALLKEQLMQDNESLRRKLNGFAEEDIVGQKGGLRGVMQKVKMSAPVDVPVLIIGETGTGKEVIANAVHELSARKGKPFVAVNCGAIPSSLIDSELFGHVKGAFTGAIAGHKGRFERADGGTLFLDEVGELPLEVQARLLRVLESGEIERVGGREPIKVDIRLIAATHRDLPHMILDGSFREDLYYRLSVVNIHVPPLRLRKQDIPQLVNFHLRRCATRHDMVPPPLATGEMERLLDYDWPGNVRELQNILEEALVCSNGRPLRFTLGQPASFAKPVEEEKLTDMDGAMRAYMTRCLKATHGKVDGPGGAAQIAGLTPSTFRFKCKKLGLVPKQIV